jgi:hypothetical protein
MSNQTNYRNVFKSDHLGVVDVDELLEAGNKPIFTISHVNQEMGAKVAGRKINANIAYFVENIKPLVLNATNSKTMQTLTGSCFVENWQNVTVELYIDRDAKLKGEVVGGVRVSPRRVNKAKKVITKETAKMWENAKKSYKENGNFNAVLKRADISPENQTLMIQEINDNV